MKTNCANCGKKFTCGCQKTVAKNGQTIGRGEDKRGMKFWSNANLMSSNLPESPVHIIFQKINCACGLMSGKMHHVYVITFMVGRWTFLRAQFFPVLPSQVSSLPSDLPPLSSSHSF